MNVEEDTFSPDEDKKPTKNRTVNVPLIIEGDEKNTITINISNYPDLIQGATLEIRNDVDLNLELLKLDARVWGFISEELKNNNNFLNQAILKCSDPGINHQIFLRMGKNARSVNPRMSHPYPD